MNEMVTDETLYKQCKQNAANSIKPFLLDVIGQQWLDLMKINIE
jgi:N-acetylgalactosamine-N,N'-diacetylbacillosaminyl-diphospho-undecaprenol 4-alpha-N-acetylgalactosaminyltransferase